MKVSHSPRTPSSKRPPKRANPIKEIVKNDLIEHVSPEEYRDKIKDVYGGPQGALLATASMLSLHIPFGRRLFRTRQFDLRGMTSILDVGSGAGQLAQHLLDFADPDTRITCTDLSHRMLCRARQRLDSERPSYITADLSALPFADATFDGITCGYVLEHLPDPKLGLAEISRVLQPKGRMFLLTTEDSFAGAWTSRVWRCRTYDRQELMKLCHSLGLVWKNELWFSPLHRAFRAGGICVEIEKQSH